MQDAFMYGNLYVLNFDIKNLQAFNIEYKAASELVKNGVYTNSAIEL